MIPVRCGYAPPGASFIITGSGLQIGSILPRELVVDGHIVQVELRR